eukprot:2737398-Rhodomonas_salina.4
MHKHNAMDKKTINTRSQFKIFGWIHSFVGVPKGSSLREVLQSGLQDSDLENRKKRNFKLLWACGACCVTVSTTTKCQCHSTQAQCNPSYRIFAASEIVRVPVRNFVFIVFHSMSTYNWKNHPFETLHETGHPTLPVTLSLLIVWKDGVIHLT